MPRHSALNTDRVARTNVINFRGCYDDGGLPHHLIQEKAGLYDNASSMHGQIHAQPSSHFGIHSSIPNPSLFIPYQDNLDIDVIGLRPRHKLLNSSAPSSPNAHAVTHFRSVIRDSGTLGLEDIPISIVVL